MFFSTSSALGSMKKSIASFSRAHSLRHLAIEQNYVKYSRISPIWYTLLMASKTTGKENSPSIVPIDAETYAMLDYAERPEAQAKFERAREELHDGKGIEPTPDYFANLNRRMSQRGKNGDQQTA
jgi:hypothetical protein